MGVKVSKNITHFHIALAMPPMQMDINYPLNIGKNIWRKITPGKFSVEKIKKPANILQDEPTPTQKHTVVMAVNDGAVLHKHAKFQVDSSVDV